MVMSKLSVIVPVYYNADTLELLYKDMQEKNIHGYAARRSV